MPISSDDIVSLSHARAHLSELADEVSAGAEKIITRGGGKAIALIAAERLDEYHRLQQERIHLLLLEDVERALDDIDARRVVDARKLLREPKKPRRRSRR